MRSSNRSFVVRSCVALAAIALSVAAAGCAGGASPSPVTTAQPTPAITPDPHLHEPASVDAVFVALGAGGLNVTANTASAGKNGQPVKLINATFAGWPLLLSQYSTAAALKTATKFDPATKPRHGESPYAIVGLNILVEFGPKTSNTPTPVLPDDLRRTAAAALVAILDRLLGPLAQRSIEPLALPAGSGGASPAPATSPVPSTP